MPALLHGPRWIPLPSPAPNPCPSTISRFKSNIKAKRYRLYTLSSKRQKTYARDPWMSGRAALRRCFAALTSTDLWHNNLWDRICIFSNSVPLSSYFIIARLTGKNRDAGGNGRSAGKGKSTGWKNLSAAADGWTGDGVTHSVAAEYVFRYQLFSIP